MEGQQQYFREMPTTQGLHNPNNISNDLVTINHRLESPDSKAEIIKPEDTNPSSTKKKNLLNESSDEEQLRQD